MGRKDEKIGITGYIYILYKNIDEALVILLERTNPHTNGFRLVSRFVVALLFVTNSHVRLVRLTNFG